MIARWIAVVLATTLSCSAPDVKYDTGTGGAAGGGVGGTATGGTGAGGGAASGGAAGAGGSSGTGGTAASGGSGATGGSATCAGSCAPNVPTGWTGPLYFYSGPSTAAPPACPNASQPIFDAFAGLTVGASSCSCSCSASGTCPTQVTAQFYSDQCGGALCSTLGLTSTCTASLNTACVAAVNVIGSQSVSCTNVTSQNFPTPTWKDIVRVCPATASAGTCASGQCIPPGGTSFSSTVCITKVGDVACPAPYSVKHLSHDSFNDTRSCGACSCNPNACGHVQLYANATGACGGTISTSINLGTCQKGYMNPPAAGARWVAGSPSCSAWNSKPPVSGTVSGTSPHTVCCAS